MIKNISISSNLIVIKTDDEKEVENFIRFFTTLDKNKAAKTLFTDETSIEYIKEGILDVIQLTKDKGFNYIEIETVIDHLCKHGMVINSEIIEYAFTEAADRLEHQNIIFCFYQKHPQLNIRINKGMISIRPMAREHLNLNSTACKKLIELLQKENSLHGCTIKDNIIYILSYTEVQNAVNSIVQVLLECHLIEKKNKEEIVEQLIQIAFKDFTMSELKVIRGIASYPNDHSLNKYKDTTKRIESIFLDLVDNSFNTDSMDKLKSALKQEGEFSAVPKIIMKSIYKLDKNFHGKLNALLKLSINGKI
ncbi:MAG: hypothetical protein U0X86_000793 [Wolbachia endosymbiont of Xenopsylla cheopis]